MAECFKHFQTTLLKRLKYPGGFLLLGRIAKRLHMKKIAEKDSNIASITVDASAWCQTDLESRQPCRIVHEVCMKKLLPY